MNEHWANLLAEWKQNRRLRLGVLTTVAILSWYSIMEWNDWLDKREKDYVKVGQQLRKLQSAVGTAELWQQRASTAASTRQQLEKRLWPATSLAVGQAAIEDWLKTSLSEIYAGRPEIKTQVSEGNKKAQRGQETASEQVASTPLRVNVAFDFSASTLERFLGTIYSQPHLIRIVSLSIKNGGRIESNLEFQLKLDNQTTPATATQIAPKGQP